MAEMSERERPRAQMDALAGLERELQQRQHLWLENRGWKHTSATPDCHWMWQIEWDGKTLLVPTEQAIRIQGVWDSQRDAELYPEQYED